MATQVQYRRGNNSQHQTFEGAAGEITVELPTNRSFGNADQAYGALWVHHGDGNIGDQIYSANQTINTIRTEIDERRFLAKLTHFSPLNNDELTADPDIMPNKWKYAWEEVSLGGLYHNVRQEFRVTVTGTAAGDGDVGIKVAESDGTYTVIQNDPGAGASAAIVAGALKTAYESSATLDIYDISIASNVLTFTAKAANAGEHLTPVVAVVADVTDSSLDSGITITISVTTDGDSYVPITGTSNDLNRSSGSSGSGYPQFAVNLCELRNDKDFIFPGYLTTLQTAQGPIPANYKVLPIGGTSLYDSDDEPVVTGTGTDGTGFRAVDKQVIVEMVERRKVDVGTGENQNPGTTYSGDEVFYYFQIPNAISGPC